ncbi:TPA: hypothetical protein O8U02_004532 [Enterobacter kobei]|uniref:toxin n=1 Tax=Enterobacter kobei TaxID=208224 RepID=UPI0021C0743F|nr:toxin [Enterobacter kobei]UXJ66654.1 toxin [Enterobacter kobei]HDC4501915.1 hypothetical protein [Enterobacter kobei]
MRIYPVSAKRAAEIERLTHKSPIYGWQRLLTYLLDRHYGLTLNDTPFGDDDAIQECIDALNEVVEDCDLARTDNRGKSLLFVSPQLTPADIRNAKNAVGLEGSNNPMIIS